MKQIKLFQDGSEQWASRLRFMEGIDIDIVITKLSRGYITSLTVCRAEYEGIVLCDALADYDVYIKASENSGAAGLIERNHIKLQTTGRPTQLKLYKFPFDLVYEGS